MDEAQMKELLESALGITAKLDEQATAIAAITERLDKKEELEANTKLKSKREAVAKEFGDVVANSLDEAGLDAMIVKIGADANAEPVTNAIPDTAADPLAGMKNFSLRRCANGTF